MTEESERAEKPTKGKARSSVAPRCLSRLCRMASTLPLFLRARPLSPRRTLSLRLRLRLRRGLPPCGPLCRCLPSFRRLLCRDLPPFCRLLSRSLYFPFFMTCLLAFSPPPPFSSSPSTYLSFHLPPRTRPSKAARALSRSNTPPTPHRRGWRFDLPRGPFDAPRQTCWASMVVVTEGRGGERRGI